MIQFVRPFDLSRAPLLRVGCKTKQDEIILLVDMHHIISDGVSHEILLYDFMALYRGKNCRLYESSIKILPNGKIVRRKKRI